MSLNYLSVDDEKPFHPVLLLNNGDDNDFLPKNYL